MKYIPLILFFFILASCNKKEFPAIGPEPEQEQDTTFDESSFVGFNMYFLKDKKLTGSDVSNNNINELELQYPPFVNHTNIEFYDTSAHIIYLYDSVTLPEMGVSVFGKPFVVTTDSIRHYVGVIWPGYSSASYRGPVIEVVPRFYPNDIVRISMGRAYPPAPDLRLNETILKTLKDYYIFHAGIHCSLDSVKILENDSLTNHCKLSYTFTVKNNDVFNLYVFDPLIMGDAHFHYYTNGIFFRAPGNIYQSTRGAQAPGAGENPLDWMIKINSGDSITRTVQKSGYPFIPKGSYDGGFSFNGTFNLGKSSREKPDGRVWMGKIEAKRSITIN